MDKKTEIAQRNRIKALITAKKAPAAEAAPTLTAAAAQAPTGWWMYHGDPEHTGFVSDSALNSTNVNPKTFTTLFTVPLGGPVLSVPAIADGYIYVGLANSLHAQGGNGGALHKIDIQSGNVVSTFNWDLGNDSRDIHSFTGMGCTPAVINGRVYFGAFNGKFYCLDQDTLSLVWVTDLRNADIEHNQPITNDAAIVTAIPVNGGTIDSFNPPAVIWSSPVINNDGSKLYVGCGEGENPALFSFVFCLDTATGNVNWIYCTNKYLQNQDNQPNVLPTPAVGVPKLPPGYSTFNDPPIVMGSSVWGAIAYDKDLNRIYCPVGNQQPEPNGNWSWDPTTQPTPPPFTPEIPSPGYSNGLLSLDAGTGAFKAYFQVPANSNYRPSDIDIDVGGSPVIFIQKDKRKVVGLACKNGSFFVMDANDLKLLNQRQMLPYKNDGTHIDTVDAHPNPADGTLNPHVPNELSDEIPGENYSGVFNTGAIHPGSNSGQPISSRIFFGMGGPNYHSASPGIDFESTPFMRAIDLESPTLADAWPMDNSDPKRYLKTSTYDPATGQTVGMYASAGESGLSSPAVVNDVVFCTTSKVSIYAFNVRDGSLLWYDDLGSQTDGYNGGYGYCLGPAIWQNFVVAGALVFGRDGGILRIYGLAPQQT